MSVPCHLGLTRVVLTGVSETLQHPRTITRLPCCLRLPDSMVTCLSSLAGRSHRLFHALHVQYGYTAHLDGARAEFGGSAMDSVQADGPICATY